MGADVAAAPPISAISPYLLHAPPIRRGNEAAAASRLAGDTMWPIVLLNRVKYENDELNTS